MRSEVRGFYGIVITAVKASWKIFPFFGLAIIKTRPTEK